MTRTLFDNLTKNGQSHLVAHLDGLPAHESEIFRQELDSVDWARVRSMHLSSGPHIAPQLPDGLKPIGSTLPTAEQKSEFWNAGMKLLSQGKAAFVLMAGGQGSRLGFDGPKGSCPLGLPDGIVLFEMIVRRLLRLKELSGRLPPFAVMTGPENDAATRDWFRDRVGPATPETWPQFFLQSAAPALDDLGCALLTQPGRLALVPDGNGGIWERLKVCGMLDAWDSQGVEWIHIAGVDNLLSLPCDPVFLGFAASSGEPLSCKSVLRTSPAEKVGVYVLDGQGRPRVAEYTELPAQTAAAKAPDDLPIFREANIASHLLRLELAFSFADQELPWHLARKKIAHIHPVTNQDLSEEFGCKYERFIFDAFPRASGMSVLRVERESEFAPVKNADGIDSPASARAALDALHRAWRHEWNLQRDPSWVDPMTSFSGERPAKNASRS